MKVAALDHLNLSVRDLEATASWYGRVFGFARVEEGVWQGVRWAILRSGGALLCAYEHRAFELPEDLPARGLHGVRHWGFRIEDEAAWRETLAREGIDFEEIRYPRSTSWYVTDPTGYTIEVALWDGNRISFGEAA